MRLTPDQQKEIAARLWGPFAQAEQRLTAGLARVQDLTLAQVRALQKQAVAEIGDLRTLGARWVETAMPSMYRAGIQAADRGLTGEAARKLARAANTRRALAAHRTAQQALAEEAQALIDELLDNAQRNVTRAARAAQAAAAQGALRGAPVPIRSAQEILDAAKGGRLIAWRSVTSGNEYSLSAAARSVSHEQVRAAIDDGFGNRCRQFGIDLVRVSRHANPCPLCGPWEGVVLSLDGQTPGYPTLEEAVADGYKHPNCYHVEDPVTDAEDRTDEDRERTLAEVADRRTSAEAKRNEYERKAQADREQFREEALAAREE